MIQIAINGFGRIGKNFLRILLEDENAKKKIKVKVINIGKGEPQASAFAFKYDSLMGMFKSEVIFKDGQMFVNNLTIPIIAELDPSNIDWEKYQVDWVIDCSGKFTKREDAEKHLKSGAKAVLISAPSHDEDVTIIPGVNENIFNKETHKIVSLGSCTTNAFAPIVKVIEERFTVESVMMTTIHSYTNSQALLDVDASTKDLRKSRAAALNIVPTTTGAMKVADKIFPNLKGRFEGISLRVPTPVVSIIDLVFLLDEHLSASTVNKVFEQESMTSLKGILDFTMQPLVSSDYKLNSHSVIVDGLLTVANKNMIKVFGWYDNEWGYSSRLKDFLLKLAP